jgi:hypothetical protein
MTAEAIAMIFTAVSCTAGATWLLRSAIAGLERALAAHVAEDAIVHAKVIELSKQRRRR